MTGKEERLHGHLCLTLWSRSTKEASIHIPRMTKRLVKSSFLQEFFHCVSKEHLLVGAAMLPDPGMPNLCPQVAAIPGLLSRPYEDHTWNPQVMVEKKVCGGWMLVSWLQHLETPEEGDSKRLGDETPGTKMVTPQEKEKITQEVWSTQLSGDTRL